MKTDNEIIQAGFDSIFSALGMVEAERFIMLIKRDQFDYTKWQRELWTQETIDSLSTKAQQAWDKDIQ